MSLFDPNKLPALQPPPGVTPNFINPHSAGAPVGAAIGIFAALATLGFISRIFTKLWIMKEVQVEDYMLFFGWAFYITFTGLTVAHLPDTAGRHQWDVTLAQLELFLQLLNDAEIFYCFCMLFTKLAILVQIRRIFAANVTKGSVYWITITLMVLNTVYYIATIIVEIAQCIPREAIWNPLVPGKCINNNANVIASGAMNFTSDILIFLLPIYAIWKLRLSFQRKIGICAVFATGFLACLSSFLRLWYSLVILHVTDLTYEIIYLAWTADLECMSALVVACFPVLPRLYQYLRAKVRDSSYRHSNKQSYDSSFESRRKHPNGLVAGPDTNIMLAYESGGRAEELGAPSTVRNKRSAEDLPLEFADRANEVHNAKNRGSGDDEQLAQLEKGSARTMENK